MDSRRIAVIACVLLVTLRLMIGWQLFYEGYWKIRTLKTPTPWTAAGYLKNAQGPLRGFFRNLAGDPDDLGWITAVPIDPDVKRERDRRYWVPAVERKWDDWQRRFETHYQLTDRQKSRLNAWINGSKTYEVDLAALPESVDFEAIGLKNYISYDPEKKRLVVDGVRHLIPEHRAKLERAVDADLDGIPDAVDIDVTGGEDADGDGIDDTGDVDATGGEDTNSNGIDDSLDADLEAEYLVALHAAFKKSKDGLSYKEQLRATVAGNPDWTESKTLQRLGEIKKYKLMLEDYERDLAKARSEVSRFPYHSGSFRWDHLQYTWGKIQAKRAELVGPVKALDTELKDKAMEMLTVEQIRRGELPQPWTPLRISDLMTIAGLTILGAMLILGLGTRLAAIFAAVMLFMFYAAMPPWPGVPEIPGPEHSFIVNKNFIEVVALMAIAALPTGRWFGVDGMIARWRANRRGEIPEKFPTKWKQNA